MQFDASPPTMKRLQKALTLNEGIIRHTMLKMGSKLSQITNYVPVDEVTGTMSGKKNTAE
jgi:ribosomal protein S6